MDMPDTPPPATQGLEDQLLALVVNKERPDLEETKTQLIIQNTEFTIKLKQLEDDLLYKLSAAEGDITEDVALIESLEESKKVATEIGEKVAEARETEVGGGCGYCMASELRGGLLARPDLRAVCTLLPASGAVQ